MPLSLVTAPATEPVTIAEVKAHLRIFAAYGEPSPVAPTVALVSPAAAGNVDNGDHRYRITFVTADGETDGGIVSGVVTVANKTVNGKVLVSVIPTGGSAVTARKLYRTVAGGSAYLLLATIADNTTVTYTDNIADASLGAGCPTTNTTVDPQLNALVKSARQMAETFTRRAFITQTWDLMLDEFPGERLPNEPLPAVAGPSVGQRNYRLHRQYATDLIRLPKPNLQSVTSINYVDMNGVGPTLWPATCYIVDAPVGDYAQRGRITLAYGQVLPVTRDIADAITIRFIAGYGSAADVPQGIKQAMLLMIGQWYDNPASQDDMPGGAKALLWNYRSLEA